MIDQFSYWHGKADCLKELGDGCRDIADSQSKYPETITFMQQMSAKFYEQAAVAYNKANEYLNHQQSPVS